MMKDSLLAITTFKYQFYKQRRSKAEAKGSVVSKLSEAILYLFPCPLVYSTQAKHFKPLVTNKIVGLLGLLIELLW